VYNHSVSSDVEKKFFGNYRGTVVSDADPLQVGRVKVRVHGFYDDVPDDAIPWALYSDPFMGGQGALGGVFVPDVGSDVWVFFENGNHMQPVYFAGAPSGAAFPKQITNSGQPESRGDLSYPRNKAIATKAGHVIELDDTEGNTRVRIAHKSGTQIIMYDNGDVYERVAGNLTRVVFGDLKEYVKGNKESHALGSLDVRANRIDLNKAGASFDISEAEQRSVSNASALVALTATQAVMDEPSEAGEYSSLIEQGYPTNPNVPETGGTTISGTPNPSPVVPVDAMTYGDIDYNMQLSPNYKLKDLTTGAVFPHTIAAQNGLSTDDIINNLKALCVNILEPLREQYSGFNINSGFRRGSSGSQHNKGMAVDIQFPALSIPNSAGYNPIIEWVRINLPFDQFIVEHGRSGPWLHISHDRLKLNQRGQTLTWSKSRGFENGLTNYYG